MLIVSCLAVMVSWFSEAGSGWLFGILASTACARKKVSLLPYLRLLPVRHMDVTAGGNSKEILTNNISLR